MTCIMRGSRILKQKLPKYIKTCNIQIFARKVFMGLNFIFIFIVRSVNFILLYHVANYAE